MRTAAVRVDRRGMRIRDKVGRCIAIGGGMVESSERSL